MQKEKSVDEALVTFKNRVSRIRTREYGQYQRAARRAVDQAIDELGLGEEVGILVLNSALDEITPDEEFGLIPYHHPDGLDDLERFPTRFRREAIARRLEEIFFMRARNELREAAEKAQDDELRKRMEERWKAISQSGEMHLLFVEEHHRPRPPRYRPRWEKYEQIIKRFGLDPRTTILSGYSRHFLPSLQESLTKITCHEIRRYMKNGTKLKLYLHEVRRVPVEGAGLPARSKGQWKPYEDKHLSAYLGEVDFEAKSFPLCLNRAALSRRLSNWLDECRKELWKRGELTEAEAQRLLTEFGAKYKEAERRSLELLRKTVGEKETDRFLKHGHLVVKSANGRIYRITRDGEVIDTGSGEEVCVEVDADEELPIYDEVLAKYLVIRDHPERIDTLEEEELDWDDLVHVSVLDKIRSQTGMTEDEVGRRIERKRAELAYQVTMLGGALLVAKELGVDLAESVGTGDRNAR